MVALGGARSLQGLRCGPVNGPRLKHGTRVAGIVLETIVFHPWVCRRWDVASNRSKRKSLDVRARVNHPIVDTDGHDSELFPVFRDYFLTS